MTRDSHLLWILLSATLGLLAQQTLAVEPRVTDPRIVEHPEDQFVVKNDPATLNCKAEGNPSPEITWYKDGQLVTTSHNVPSSHRMMLPGGQLFFLRIIHNKNQKPDIGVYYCNATNPVSGVSVVSRNATLMIASIKDDFRVQPRNTEVAVGDTAVLDCRGPRGEPEPRLEWKKDGNSVKPSENPRYTVQDTGSLMIQDARKEDTGIYVCIAQNNAGERESDPARLLVLEKPQFEVEPASQTVEQGADVEFKCQASGDPPPTIVWKKKDGRMPEGRVQVQADKSLRIENVRVNDEGTYICSAENSVGADERAADLTVHTIPTFVVTPQDKAVGFGRRVSFRCEVIGNPVPTLFWNKDDSKILMFPGHENERFKVLDDGKLVIDPVLKEDEGVYICQGMSKAGVAYSRALLTVKDVDPRPPPIIHQGPQNQTLPIDSVAMLRCSTSVVDPRPTISWLKDGRIISKSDPRITQLGSGTLQISDLKQSDTGIYTCRATSETGETLWDAGLIVEVPSNSQVIFHRTPEPSTFPGAPSKPQVENLGDTSITLSWKSNSNHGASPVYVYTVEYFSHETGEGWIVASDSIKKQEYTVQDLLPDTPYMFLVRAQNAHGLSLPSRVTDPIITRGTGRPGQAGYDPDLIREKLADQLVELKEGRLISSTAIELKWEVLKLARFIEGFHIKYRVIPDPLDRVGLGASHSDAENDHGHTHHHHIEYTIETIPSNTQTTHTLRNLNKYTWYEIRIQPYYQDVQGQDSNTVRTRTLQDLPAAAPENIQTILYDNNTARITWQPPPKHLRNGPIDGYRVLLYVNGSNLLWAKQTNQTVMFVTGLNPGMSYTIQVLAFNQVGEGVKSHKIAIGEDLAEKWYQQKWVVGVIVGVVAAAICIGLCAFSVWVHKKKRAKKKGSHFAKNGMMSVPLNKSEESSRPVVSNQTPLLSSSGGISKDLGGNNGRTLYPPLYPPLHQQQQQQPDVTNVGTTGSTATGSEQMSDTENLYNTPNVQPMKTFYNKNQQHPAGPVSPYATTTLLQNPGTVALPPSNTGVLAGGCGGGSSAFRPIQHNQHHTGSHDGSCGKQELMTSSDSNNETRSNAGGRLSCHSTPLLPHRRATPRHTPATPRRRTTPKMMPKTYDPSLQELIPQCEQCGDRLHSPMSDCESMMTEYDDPSRLLYPGQPGLHQPPMLFLPPPPEHPPPSDIGTPPDSPTQGRSRMMMGTNNNPGALPPHMGFAPPGRTGSYHSNTTGSNRDDSPHFRNSPRGNSSGQSDNEQYRGAYPQQVQQPPPYGSLGCNHHPNNGWPPPTTQHNPHTYENSGGGHPNHHHHHHQPGGQPHYRTVDGPPNPAAVSHMRAYSPRAMSEPERGPTPPIRAYKLVPIRDNPLANEAVMGGSRHYSDNEGAPLPPVRMINSHAVSADEQPPSPAPEDRLAGGGHLIDPMRDCAIQSSLPSLASECINGVGHQDGGMMGRDGSPISEVGNFESDMEGGRRTPESFVGDVEVAASTATWGSDNNSDNNSSHLSVVSSSDESFFAEADFASAVAKAAEMSGLTVVGSTVCDPNSGKDKVKKYKKPRDRPKRPTSPYSTDSNYSSIPPHKPYPKSERRKQMQEKGSGASSGSNPATATSQDDGSAGGAGGAIKAINQISPPSNSKPPVKAKPQLPPPQHVADLPSYNKPSFPSTSPFSAPGGMTGMPPAGPRSPPNNGQLNIRTNPMAAFDTTDTPIV